MQQPDRSRSESLYWPTILAVGLHVIIFATLFVSFAMTPELPPSKPIVQATLYQLKSQSQAKVQTNQKIAGEAQKTAAKQYEAEQLEQRKVEQQKQAAAKAAEQKKADEARKAEAAKADAAKKASEAKKADEAKKAEQQKQAEIAKKKAAEEAQKKKAAEEAKKKAAAEAAKKKAAEDAKKKAAAEAAKKKAAEEAKKKAATEAARKAAEDKKAQALAELLSDDTERQQALADTQGDQTSGNFDDLIRMRAAENWTRPPSARNSMSVTLRVNMLPDGTITAATVSRSSGDAPFDSSAVAAVKNIGRLTEMQGLSAQDFQPYRSFTMTFTPEDLAL
ncbi:MULTISPECIES: cell envelope integrity protein TolA [Stutzerimonas]|jgi:colicin import membrane protein|uniref:Cell division and transport-associated protein TolA n=1 Tax=Stutzerimonas stutzeri TaxID=316 RepID=A0A5S5BHV3_STUST|nr:MULTISPECIES: cell envelope integrity protein TolA [Stutzerimonas]MBU0852604.1 cell envelope integrity protein TolA [Gammaproteobacteria bacterium]MBK3847130.1 cell envelope integrity protein TolA [Stutzerimonas xanthomarina]MBU1301372.1 cell envelope integrity protein TolA [Gammaproteobacteria bacterium]MBU1460030.1 cell envelope integrity protein TolA [Gammaproteobacteria bacterium]MBU1774320.1 cell envelope integrity protein TolA [Gammaproteobacteria bacterium]|tara:strand:- start:4094 stop:5098 length:1005 start_codon:yes stop_codon:yes gene_type:complete